MDESKPQSPTPPTTFTVGSTVVPPSSAEIAFALRQEQFETLCEGETSTDRAGRDLCAGLFVGAVVGLVGVLATTDWATIWQADRRMPFIGWSTVLLLIVSGSLVGTIVCWVRYRRTCENSSYARLKKRIENWFVGNQQGQ